MREVFANRGRALEKGTQAAADMQKRYSLNAVSQAMSLRLSDIRNSFNKDNLTCAEQQLFRDAQLRKSLAQIRFHYETRQNWAARTQPIANRLTLYRILRWILKPMFDQQADYLQATLT